MVSRPFPASEAADITGFRFLNNIRERAKSNLSNEPYTDPTDPRPAHRDGGDGAERSVFFSNIRRRP